VSAPERSPVAAPRPGATCLLSGASGFIGGAAAARLLDAGYSVRCLVRPTSDTTRLLALGVELVRGDLRTPDTLVEAAAGCECALHCAALVSDWATVAEIAFANVAGTRNLLDACLAANVTRFVQVSSTDIYGHPGAKAVEERCPPGRFSNWYAQTKLEAEAEVHRAERLHGLPAVILRPATVYGPGSRDVIGEIARAIRAGNMLLIERGRAIAGLCYVENLLDAALLALAHPAAPGETFNVTDGSPITWKRLTDDLAAGLGCPPPRWSLPYPLAAAIGTALEQGYRLARRATGLHTQPLLSRQAVQVLGRDQDFSNRKARELLGWEPRIGYAEGLEATLGWLREL
jgi:oxidoreductase